MAAAQRAHKKFYYNSCKLVISKEQTNYVKMDDNMKIKVGGSSPHSQCR